MTTIAPVTSLDLRGKTITTYILWMVHDVLRDLEEGDRVEVVTDSFPAIDSDVRAWSRTSGNMLVDVVAERYARRFTIEKGPEQPPGQKLAAVISDDGLLDLLSPLGFALAAALEGHDVALYFQGPAVRVLEHGFVARMHGLGRPFSRFPRRGLEKSGHVSPQEKIHQLQELGATIYACGPSMQHYRVRPGDLAFENVRIAEYLTFMEELEDADIHLFV